MFYQILVQIIGLCIAYDLKCPEPAEWFMRSRLLCPNPSKYSCLHNDFAPGGFSENCSIIDFEPAGRIIILRGGIDATDCTQNRYQPERNPYRTNISTDCIYFKSLCNEEGQVVYKEDPDYTSDTTCRCDYTRGYDFVTRPSHPCYCIPSQEDCSCYIKRCSSTLHVVSPDYQCIDRTKNVTSSCPVLTKIKIQDMDHVWNVTHLTDIQSKREKWSENMVIVLICCVIVATVQFTSDLKVVSVSCMEGQTVKLQCTTKGGKGEEIPKAIQQLSEKDKELYMGIMKDGTETRKYIRVVIIGENGVGKTCLLRRLLKQSTTEVHSTDGVEMHRCRINMSNGEWISEARKPYQNYCRLDVET